GEVVSRGTGFPTDKARVRIQPRPIVVGFLIDAVSRGAMACLGTSAAHLALRFPSGSGFPVLFVAECNAAQDSLTKVVEIVDGRLDNGGVAIEAIQHTCTAWTQKAEHP